MKVFVDSDLCLGCGICEGIAPDVFTLGPDPIATVLLNPVPENLWADVRESAEQCPEEAITIEE
jgi:ferredoxin